MVSLVVKKPVTVMVIDHAATGKKARALRESVGVPGRTVARRMSIAPGSLSRLESGQAKWTEELGDRYARAVERIREAKKLKAELD